MIISAIIVFLGLVIGLLNLRARTRNDDTKKLTRWGKVVVALSVAVCVLSVWKIWQDSEREKYARFAVTESDVTIELTASMVNENPSEDILAATPSSLRLGIVVPNEGGWECIMEPLPGFVHSGPGHGPVVLTRIYLTKITHAMNSFNFKYVWDLADKKVLIRNPQNSFSDISRGELVKRWQVRPVVRIKGFELRPRSDTTDKGYWVEFDTEELRRVNVLAKFPL